MRDEKNSSLVYSTDSGRVCPECGQAAASCRCSKKKPPQPDKAKPGLPKDGVARIMRDTKGRKGKGVTLVAGLPLGAVELAALAKTLKQKCGAGGAVKDGVIEIQGDHRQTILDALTALGHKAKLAGG